MGLFLAYKAAGIARAFEREALRFIDPSFMKHYRSNYSWGTPTGNQVFDMTARQSRDLGLGLADNFALSVANFMKTATERKDSVGYSIFDHIATINYDLIREELSHRVDKALLDAWITRPPF